MNDGVLYFMKDLEKLHGTDVQIILKDGFKAVIGKLVDYSVSDKFIVLENPFLCSSYLMNTGFIDSEMNEPQVQFHIEPVFPFSSRNSGFRIVLNLEEIVGIAPCLTENGGLL